MNVNEIELQLTPLSLTDANAFVAKHHRHHKPVRGHKFSLGCIVGGQLVGVAIVGRPVSRYLDDGLTLCLCEILVIYKPFFELNRFYRKQVKE